MSNIKKHWKTGTQHTMSKTQKIIKTETYSYDMFD